MPGNNDFYLVPHTADLKLHVSGTTLKDLFKHAVMGMFQVIKPKAPGCMYKNDRLVCPQLPVKHPVDIESYDVNSLLVDFLSYALTLSDIHNEAYLDVQIVYLNNHHLKGELRGVPITGFEVIEIKAVTYHNLEVQQTIDGWQAEIVFDI